MTLKKTNKDPAFAKIQHKADKLYVWRVNQGNV